MIIENKKYKLDIIERIEQKPFNDKNGHKLGYTNKLLNYMMTIEEKIGNTKRLSSIDGDNIQELLNKFLTVEGFKIKFKDKIRKWLRNL